jgi:hypothetical protein
MSRLVKELSRIRTTTAWRNKPKQRGQLNQGDHIVANFGRFLTSSKFTQGHSQNFRATFLEKKDVSQNWQNSSWDTFREFFWRPLGIFLPNNFDTLPADDTTAQNRIFFGRSGFLINRLKPDGGFSQELTGLTGKKAPRHRPERGMVSEPRRRAAGFGTPPTVTKHNQ